MEKGNMQIIQGFHQVLEQLEEMTNLVQEPWTCSNKVKNTQLKVPPGKHNVSGDFRWPVVLNETPDYWLN